MQGEITLVRFLLLVGLSGCASIGPGTVARDRFDYITAISDSWKSQTLLNLVKIRYGDAPVFLDVASVINSYGLETQVSLAASWAHFLFSKGSTSVFGGPTDAQSLGATTRYTDKPTITYTPLSGEKFARNLMTPTQPVHILNLIQAGYPIDLVLRALVHSINSVHTRFGGSARGRLADPEFYPLAAKMRKIQLSGEIGMRVERVGDRTATLMIFGQNPTAETAADIAEVRQILRLDPKARELSVVYGSVASNDKEIALLTRTMLEILVDLGSYIQVPLANLEEGRTYPTPPAETANGAAVVPLIQILSSAEPPKDAFAAVPYRNVWYWIDDKDFRSKSFFSFVMFLFTLTETGDKQGAPVITLPAG